MKFSFFQLLTNSFIHVSQLAYRPAATRQQQSHNLPASCPQPANNRASPNASRWPTTELHQSRNSSPHQSHTNLTIAHISPNRHIRPNCQLANIRISPMLHVSQITSSPLSPMPYVSPTPLSPIANSPPSPMPLSPLSPVKE